MAFLQCNFHSDALGKACGMNVLIPQRARTQIGLKSGGGDSCYPVLYLLHGLSDDYTIWMRRTAIERYVAQYNLVVVMPDGGRSFYTDMVYGGDYWTFLSEELPEIVGNLFPVCSKRENTFAAGLSMGGYGALKLGLRRPDRYAMAGALSPVTEIGGFLERRRSGVVGSREADSYFGPGNPPPPEDDLFALAEEAGKLPAAERPALFQACGTEDALYPENLRFRDHLEAIGGFDYRFISATGDHTWEFWDEYIREFLAALPLKQL